MWKKCTKDINYWDIALDGYSELECHPRAEEMQHTHIRLQESKTKKERYWSAIYYRHRLTKSRQVQQHIKGICMKNLGKSLNNVYHKICRKFPKVIDWRTRHKILQDVIRGWYSGCKFQVDENNVLQFRRLRNPKRQQTCIITLVRKPKTSYWTSIDVWNHYILKRYGETVYNIYINYPILTYDEYQLLTLGNWMVMGGIRDLYDYKYTYVTLTKEERKVRSKERKAFKKLYKRRLIEYHKSIYDIAIAKSKKPEGIEGSSSDA